MRSILAVALLTLGCVPPTAVLDQGAPELGQSDGGAVLDGDWRIVFSDGGPDECMTFQDGILIDDDEGCDGESDLIGTVPVQFDEVGPILAFEFEDGTAWTYFFTDTGDGTFLVTIQDEMDEIIGAGIASPTQ